MCVPQVGQEIVEGVQTVLQERILERVVEHIIVLRVPQVWEDLVGVVKLVPQERVQ